MPAKIEEITGKFVGARHRFDDVLIGEIELVLIEPPSVHAAEFLGAMPEFDLLTVVTIKGPADPDDLQYGQTYRFYGHWSNYFNKRLAQEERQFHFVSFVRSVPHGREGVIRYLQTAPGIGTARAAKLWDAFGGDAVQIAREHPEQAAELLGISLAKAREAAEYLASEIALESCTIDMIDLLGGRGFPRDTAKRVLQVWGNKAAGIIRRNPYILMNFRGCGFKKTDAMYLDLKLPRAKLKRQALSAWHALARDSEGHTWFPVEQAVAGIKSNVGGCELNPEKALRLAIRHDRMRLAANDGRGAGGGLLAKMRTAGPAGGIDPAGNKLWLAEGKKAKHERDVAESVALALAEAADEPDEWPPACDVDDVSDHQRENVGLAIAGRIGILAGSPGTGKTFAAARIIRAIIASHGSESVAVAAPTGKAAVRISEAMQSYGITIRARTIHSLLGVASRGMGGSWGFQHGKDCPLPFQFIVVDESSMIDTDLMAALLAARGRGTHILFVGDPNQLPPVGHGAPLRDLIAAGIPYGELREIRRNSGAIVRACAEIRDGQGFRSCASIDPEAGENLYAVPATNVEDQVAKLMRALEMARGKGLNPVWDCQVLVPVNAKSRLSRKELNRDLQRALNANPGTPGSPFIVGDKIVNTKNGFFPLAEAASSFDDDEVTRDEEGKAFVANGELAEVLKIEEKLFVAKLTSPTRIIKIPRGKAKDAGSDDGESENSDEEKTATGSTWDLGYALSVHKSQGSEWPIVIVMIDEYPGARRVCSREWIYTGISRAKKLCLLIGRKMTADGFCRSPALHKRKTFLAELLREEMRRGREELERAAVAATVVEAVTEESHV